MAHRNRRSVAWRVLSILDAFDVEHVELSLSEIASRANVPIATCHRMVAELVKWGGLVRHKNQYRVGHKVWQLGLLSSTQQDLKKLAAPYMHDVLFLTKHVVNLFVLDDGQALLLERISGTEPGPAVAQVGEHMYLHASAAGKILLAYSRKDPIEDVRDDLAGITKHTITDPTELREEVLRAKSKGYAMTSQEAALGAFGVAVPIRLPGGELVAALGVVLVHREPRIDAIVPVLQAAARGIGREVSRAPGYGYIEGEN